VRGEVGPDATVKVVAWIAWFVTAMFTSALCVFWFWSWFAVPIGAPELPSMWAALGISMLFSAMKGLKLSDVPRESQKHHTSSYVMVAIAPLIWLGIGWVVAWFGGIV
jgi:hypothetical protein